MTLGLKAARRFTLLFAALLLLTIAPVTPVATAESNSPYATLGHAWMSVNSNLRAASHISAWAIDDYLAHNTPLPPLGHAFKAAEAKYDVNALYLLAHAMHETGFGTSFIGQRFHNLFGWNAYDRDPTGMASRFPTYAASIDYVASQIAELYLSPTGKFYGGAATLRGMHYYASDPQWATLIARIANGIVLPTLAKRGIVIADPVVGDADAGKPLTVTITTKAGTFPDGIEAAYRFIPVAVVEAGVTTGAVPPADPEFKRATGDSADDKLRVTVTAPTRAGRYRLELQLRDSDGSELTEYDVPSVPDAAVRVYGADAVSYDLTQKAGGLTVAVSNEGQRAIPASGPVAGGSAGAVPTMVPSTLSAWVVDGAGTPTLLTTIQVTHTLKPGATWTTDLPAPDPALLPAILVIRLDVGGDPARLGGSPPGVFRLAADGTATPDPADDPTIADPSASPDPAASPAAPASPSASTSTDPSAPADPAANPNGTVVATGIGAASPVSSAAGGASSATDPKASVPLQIGALTPVDAATRMLLNPDWRPAPTKAVKPKASVTATSKGIVRLAYQPLVTPKQAGTATIRITNSGTQTLVASLPQALLDANASAPTTEESSMTAVNTTGTALLVITAVPAWGPATEATVLRIPLSGDVAPGKSVDVGFALPAGSTGQSTYLIVARVMPANGGPAYPATLFWLRGARPTAAAQAAALSATTGRGPTVTGSASSATSPATAAAAAAASTAANSAAANAAATTVAPAAGSAPAAAAAAASTTTSVVPLALLPALNADPEHVGGN